MPPSFVVWGFLNLLAAQLGANYFTMPGGSFVRNGAVVSSLIWIAIGFFVFRIRLPLVLSVAMVLVLQAWQLVGVYVASSQIGRTISFNAFDVLFLRYLALFFTAGMLVTLGPRMRWALLWVVIAPILLQAAIAFLQFGHVQAAIDLSRLNTDLPIDITNWDKRGGLRAVGMHGFPGPMAITAIFGASIFAGLQVARRLRWYEHAAFGIFVIAAVLPQARTHLPALAIVFLVYVGTLIAREKGRAAVALGAFAAVAGLVAVLGGQNLQYAFGENWLEAGNLQYRQRVAWAGASEARKSFPWTGIGVDPSFFGDQERIPDKWASTIAFDNGWLVLAAAFGLIGQTIFALALLAGVVAPFRAARDSLESRDRVGWIVACALMVVALGLGMLGNNVLHWLAAMNSLAIAAGIAMRTRTEEAERTRVFRCTPRLPMPGRTQPVGVRPGAFATRNREP